jgi:hypothetical protein
VGKKINKDNVMKCKNIIKILAVFLCSTVSMYADAILFPLSLIPSVGNPWWMVVQFFPIVFLEAFIFKKYLKVVFLKAVKLSFCANFVSTFAGIPFGVIVNRGGFGNFLGLYPSSYGLIYSALETIILILSCFVLSYYVEYLVIRQMHHVGDGKTVRRAVLYANLASYGCIVAWWIFIIVSNDAAGFVRIGGYKIM